jgi:hypothetical protein
VASSPGYHVLPGVEDLLPSSLRLHLSRQLADVARRRVLEAAQRLVVVSNDQGRALARFARPSARIEEAIQKNVISCWAALLRVRASARGAC